MPLSHSIAYEVARAGGYGRPANRNPQSIHQDLINGYITPTQAAQDYAVDPSTMLCPHCGGVPDVPRRA